MLFLLPVGIFVLDRLVKIWANGTLSRLPRGMTFWPGVLQLYYTENTGMAFGFLSGRRWILILLSLAAVIAVYFAIRPYKLGLWAKLSLLSVLGGRAGNLADRIFLGYVVD
jgi:signal peptidase II